MKEEPKKIVYTHCIYCGKKLKDPVSQLQGMGETCCKKKPHKNKPKLF